MDKRQEATPDMSPGDDPAAFERVRARRHTVAEAPFAGRIGGNQEFVVHPDDEDSKELLKKQPDAVSQPMRLAEEMPLKEYAGTTFQHPRCT